MTNKELKRKVRRNLNSKAAHDEYMEGMPETVSAKFHENALKQMEEEIERSNLKRKIQIAQGSIEGFRAVTKHLYSKLPPVQFDKPLTADEICKRIKASKKK